MILEGINGPSDLKKLNKEQLHKLPAEIREFLIENVSKTGGHLASNLGVVELTIALHLTFDLPNDKIVWDVGHQAYVHKLLTGRRERFPTLRKLDGLSGFPKPNESEFDSFIAGHSSTSISAALGMAIANAIDNAGEILRKPQNPIKTVAIIGDGALTGGMAFEALNHAGSAKVPMIIVLNDNGMSISKNVGGVARYLNKIRNNPIYFHIKDDVKSVLGKTPLVGKPLRRGIHRVKSGLKNLLVGGKMFENFGLTYLGPVDGHDIGAVSKILRRAESLDEPVLVHVLTKKGKGYTFAEENPNKFHGIGAFDVETGEIHGETDSVGFSETFGETLCEIAERNPKVAAITAAMPDGTGLCEFAKRFPERLFDVGIAEQHAVTMAAGMAASGKTPVVAVYSTFLQRAYDQILHDVALSNLHVVFAIDRAGCVGRDGETHQGIYDLSYLLHIPNMTVLAPSSNAELAEMLDFAVNEMNSPVAIRYPRNAMDNECRGELCSPVSEDGYRRAVECRPYKGNPDILIISLGTMLPTALEAAKILESRGISAAVINARFAKPLDLELIKRSAANCKIVATIEDNVEIGGFGSYVESRLARNVVKFGFPDKFIEQGSVEEIFERYGLTAERIAAKLAEEFEAVKL